MKLRELFEARQRSVGIIFGRFNPPHKGHRAAWEMASENDAWFVGTNQSTQGPKDPLPYDVKIEAMKAIYPEIQGHIMPEQSWLTMASAVYKKYGNVVLNLYTDEEWVSKAINQYNGQEGPHGLYNFKVINTQPTPRLSSATALRAAVQAGDREAFADAAGVDADTPVAGQAFFDLVAQYLNPYTAKEKIKVAKKKVKEPELNELSSDTVKSYKAKAQAQVKELEPHAKKGEYKDLAQRVIDRRERGIKRAEKRVGEEAAGVGIITKQNTTVDVNKGTPRKNLKAFKLV
jgi:nicotinamide mononucleotide adenylyltransferase